MLQQEVLQSLWYRLNRHNIVCTQEQVTEAVRMQATRDEESMLNVALRLYWILREGHKEQLPFLAQEFSRHVGYSVNK